MSKSFGIGPTTVGPSVYGSGFLQADLWGLPGSARRVSGDLKYFQKVNLHYWHCATRKLADPREAGPRGGQFVFEVTTNSAGRKMSSSFARNPIPKRQKPLPARTVRLIPSFRKRSNGH
jgi:hypothetical protein